MRPPPARATGAIALATVALWAIIALLGWQQQVVVAGGFIPGRVSGTLEVVGGLPVWLTPLSATLLHAGVLHLGFNLVMLIYCGQRTEAALGPAGIVVLYVVGAYAAAAAQYLAEPTSAAAMIGASGAISAVLGSYALLYGRHGRASVHPKLNLAINMLWLAAAWIGIQLLFGFATSTAGTSIAVAAHIGGFLAGLVLARPLLMWRYWRA